tara:strand:- start:5914 stop:6327 length:414 start_codon:yes stop_codon:yes gene_type:complete
MADGHRIIVAGSRTFTDYKYFREVIIDVLKKINYNIDVFITGRALDGPDDMIYHFCRWDHKFDYVEKKANWKKYGNAAGMLRNIEMAEIATGLVAFWDGKSKGTKQMIDEANKRGLEVLVVMFDADEQPTFELFEGT